MRKKILSWVLTVVMLVSTLGAFPLTAAAAIFVCETGGTQYETLGAGLTAAAAAGGGTVVLLTDISYSSQIAVTSGVTTIDLNGHDLTVSGVADHALKATNGATLNILDVDGDGGTLTVSSSGEYRSCAYAASGGDINITGNLTASFTGGMSYQEIIALNATGAGSTITLIGSATGYYAGACAQNSAVITVTGNVEGNYYGAYAAYGGTLDITGDVTAVTRGLTVEYGGQAEIDGDITGGTGIYTNNTSGWAIPTADVEGNVVSTSQYAIQVNNDGDVDVEGNITGCVEMIGTSSDSSIYIIGDIHFNESSPAVYHGTGTLVITGDIYAPNGYALASNGTMTLNGDITAMNGVYSNGLSGNVTVNGNIVSDNGFGVYIDNGATVTVNGTITGASTYIRLDYVVYTEGSGIVEGDYMKYSCYTNNNPAYVHTVYVLIPQPVCEVEGIEYYTLDEGIAAAAVNNETIKLLDDIDYDGQLTVTSYIDLNLNGHTLNVVNDSGTGTSGAGLYANGEDLDISGEGEFNVTGTTYGVYVIEGGSADVTTATATADGGIAVFLDSSGSRTSVGVLGDATADGISGIGVYASSEDCIAVVYGDVSADGTDGTGVQVLDGATVTVRGYIDAVNYINIQHAVYNEGNYSSIVDNYYIYTDGNSTVKARQEVCALNGTPYLFLEDAFEDAEDGDTLTLLTNIRSLNAISIADIDLLLDLDTYTLDTGVAAGTTPAITVDGGSLSIDETGGGKLNIFCGVTAVKAINGAVVEVSSITNVGTGVNADGAGSFVTVTGNVTASVGSGIGLVLKNGAGAYIEGNLSAYNAIQIEGDSVTVTVDGTITATGGFGLSVINGSNVTVFGSITAVSYGVYAHGAPTEIGGVDVYGDVTSTGSIGASVWSGATVTIHGDVSSKSGVHAREEGATLTVTGDVTSTDSYYYGAWVDGGGVITIGGTFTAASDEMFIYFGSPDAVMTEEEGVFEGHYTVYTDGESTVRTKGYEFFFDDCEGALSDNWTYTTADWSFTSSLSSPTATAYSGSQAAMFNAFNEADCRMYLNEGLDMSKGDSYWLEFWMYHDTGTAGDDYVIAQISYDGGSSWTDMGTYYRNNGNEGWEFVRINLSYYMSFANVYSDILIGFYGIPYAGNNIYLDDISVSHECIIDGCDVTEAYGGFISSQEIEGETYYEVTSAAQLAHVSDHLNLNYIQTADIDLSQYNGGNWIPIGGFGDPDNYCTPDYFTGKYLGNDFAIQNLYLYFNDSSQNSCHAGIFAYVDGMDALISDLTVTVTGADLTCYNYPDYGTIASILDGGTIRNCDVIIEGDVITSMPNGDAGGIVATAWSSYDSDSGTYVGAIENCTVTLESGSILTEGWSKRTGGIAGYCTTTVSDCDVIINAGECIRGSNYTGGITGTLGKYSSATNCTVTGEGSIEAYPQKYYSQYIGGIAGYIYEATIADCYNEVAVDATGVTKISQGKNVCAGGIAGYVGSLSTITGCGNTADVEVEIANSVVDYYDASADPNGDEHAYAGGIAGYVYGYSKAVTIENCENNANISATNLIPTLRAYAGGLAGHIDSANGDYAGVTVLNCANLGQGMEVTAIASTTMAGGLAGSTTYTDFTTPNILIQNCYNEARVYTESNGPAAVNSFCVGVTAGGLIGAAGEVTVNYCYSTAPNISAANEEYGDAYEGGLFGLLYNTAASQNYCETNENVIRASGAIVDGMTIVAENDLSGSYECATAAQLKTKSFYGNGWSWYTSGSTAPDYYSSTSPWRMTAANAYPVLKGEAYTEPTTPPAGGGGTTVTYYSITASAGVGGSIDPAGNVSVQKNLSKTFSITPESGYVIADVLVDGVSVGAVTEYTFSEITEDHTITASFEHPSSRFTDVDGSLWYREGIDFVLTAGLFNGTSDTTFKPNTDMSRAMLVTVLWRLDNEPDTALTDLFADIAAGTWYTDAVAWASEASIVEGYDANTFGPDDSITREQMAAILYRYASYKGYDVTAMDDLSGFDDAGDTSDWALAAMQWAVAEGLIQGVGGNQLDPAGHATRAQVATILMRFVQNIVE